MSKAQLFLCLWLLPFGLNHALAATIRTEVDRNPVQLDESFQITFTATDQPDEEPDFSPLNRDFEIRGQTGSSQTSWINGRASRQIQWIVAVMAKHAGDIAIPAIAFGKDRSQPITVRVENGGNGQALAPNEHDELFIEVDAEPKKPYVQAQVLYTIRILHQVDLANARMDNPKLDDAVVERVGEDRQYIAQRNGRTYNVFERRYAIFPQKSGRLGLPAPVLDAELGVGRGALFNRFFYRQGGDAVRVRGKALELDVRPIPAQFTGQHWLPVKALTLTETWSKHVAAAEPPTLTVGEPLTRTLRLEAQAGTVGTLPELTQENIAGLQAYPDRPALNEERGYGGLNATREEKIALMPSQPGHYTLPEIVVPWWNTETDREEIARIPAHTVIATAAASDAARPATPPPAISDDPAQAAAEPLPPTPVAATEPPYLWMGATAFCALGWLATAFVGWRSRRATTTHPPIPADNREPSEKTLRRRLREACLANDAPTARATLLAWAQARWPTNPPNHLGQINRLAGPAVADQIERLNRASYGNAAETWDGAALWQALSKLPVNDAAEPPSDGLEPLYRSQPSR